jgi:hypothetical protein
MKSARSRQQGFTFLEMALTLFTMGFLLSAVPRLLSQGTDVMAAAPGALPTDAGQLALNGFVIINHRLPCPASGPFTGVENCSIDSGYVPYKTLGLPRPVTNNDGFAFGYAVLRDNAHNNDLAVASAKYTPTYFYTTGNYWEAPPTRTSTSSGGAPLINGLDFCAKLRHAATLGQQSAQTGIKNVRNPTQRINVAWVLVDPGQRNADGSTGTSFPGEFDGANQPGLSNLFESPSQPQTQTYDDTVSVGTLTQMFGELQCPQLLASVSAAAREADFANDNWRVRKFLYDFRAYELKVRNQKQIQAVNFTILAAFDITMTVALGALDLGIALAGPSGAAAIAISVINAVTSISMSAYNMVNAAQGLSDANAELTEGNQRVTDASTAVTDAATFRSQREAAMLLLDQRGWFE